MDLTRRHMLAGGLGVATFADIAAAWQHVHQARKQGAGFEAFTATEAAEVEALASQILPSDDGPGAREAGVVHFIDRALATFDAAQRELYRSGMTEVQQIRRRMFPDSQSVAALPPARQIELMRSIDKLPFFEALRTHTVIGFLSNPAYGGNRGGVGWAYIGFEDRMSFQPPFGYYDAEASK